MSAAVLGLEQKTYLKVVYSVILFSMIVGVLALPFTLFYTPDAAVPTEMPQMPDFQGDPQDAAMEYMKKIEKIAAKNQATGGGMMSIIFGLQSIIGVLAFCGWVLSVLAATVFKDKFDEFGLSHMGFVAVFCLATFLIAWVLLVLTVIPLVGALIFALYTLLTTFLFFVAYKMYKEEKVWELDPYQTAVKSYIAVYKNKIESQKAEVDNTNYLVLLRHGQSEWNLANKFTGFHDVDLTEKGEEEAEKAGELLKEAGIHFDKVFSSTQTRANKTAQIVLQTSGQPELFDNMVKHPHLRERDYGDLTGLDKDETREKYGEEQVHIWRRSYDTAPPGGECLKDVVENRVKPYFLQHIKPLLDNGKNVLMAAHGNSLRATLITLGVETPDTINDAEFPTGVPLVFEMEHGEIKKRYFLGK